ncbi:GNAT family N-acetyltransferase [Labedaea rhizosphaerae]|uniref:RimJ/RimL family protein N-acetyltransferase n=1 Tax=Labedaea rhizosphaerae TaxID=598644 RepID=A0A4R6RRC7_LABRH|nr:GNAT family N-acetyltransferase [Labedaea rhizosphaerae]TDP89371.1 RimJ/RimL family protein N-acetyltransferase [Labedaea rhizosphaerae]
MLIETPRLDLVPLQVEHADEMAQVLADPSLHAFIGGVPATAGQLRSRYERVIAGPSTPGESWLNWVIRLRDEDCLTGYVQATVSGDTAEIAWVVGTAWQGRGIAGEAASALVEWLPVRTVVAHIHPEHKASAAVAAAAGLAPTDVWQDGELRWTRNT